MSTVRTMRATDHALRVHTRPMDEREGWHTVAQEGKTTPVRLLPGFTHSRAQHWHEMPVRVQGTLYTSQLQY
jgi:hypothetical protein